MDWTLAVRLAVSVVCVIGAVIGATRRVDGWGWFLFVAVIALPTWH